MDELKNSLKEKRPNLSANSLTTYGSILKNLYKKIWGSGSINLDDFNQTDKVLEFLKELPPNKRKTILSALVVLTDKKDYSELMADDIAMYNKEIAKQEKSDTQKENWITGDEIKLIYDNLKKTADTLLKKKELTNADHQNIQNYIIVSLLGGIYIAPRRSLDYVEFKIKPATIDKTKDNYLDKNKMVFNTYKTAKTYGQQIVEVPTALKSILTKWIKRNPTEYLLFDTNGNKLSSVKLNQRLNKIFGGKNIAVNALRHSYLTDKYKDVSVATKQLAKDMNAMGSSTAMADTYIKID